MVYFYLPAREEDIFAIEYYVSIIIEAFESIGEKVEIVNNLDKVKKGSIVAVTTVNDCARVLLKIRRVTVYTWFQGVVPEEMAYNSRGVRKVTKYILWSLCEMVALWGSRACLFVSEAMRNHYRHKYLYIKNNYMIMPCFNQKIEPDAFKQEKYETPSFIYSGSLRKWQCFNQTISTFVEIKRSIPDARLTVFTQNVEPAKNIIEKAGLRDVDVRCVPYKELPEQMKRFKYGFLIREKHLLNKVATPTKMSSYIGCGVIPVFSPVMSDFNSVFGDLKYIVKAGDNIQLIRKIKEIESSQVRAADILSEYQSIFDDYYSREKYVKQIGELFTRFKSK